MIVFLKFWALLTLLGLRPGLKYSGQLCSVQCQFDISRQRQDKVDKGVFSFFFSFTRIPFFCYKISGKRSVPQMSRGAPNQLPISSYESTSVCTPSHLSQVVTIKRWAFKEECRETDQEWRISAKKLIRIDPLVWEMVWVDYCFSQPLVMGS